jgi:hypothetical protein
MGPRLGPRGRPPALGIEPGAGLAQVLDLASQGLKLPAQLAQLSGAFPGLPALLAKLGLLGLAAAAPLFGQGALLAGLGAGLVVDLALLGHRL